MNDFYCPWVGDLKKNFNTGLYLSNIGDSAFCFRDMTDMDNDYISRGHCMAPTWGNMTNDNWPFQGVKNNTIDLIH